MIGDVTPESPGEIFEAELLDVDSKSINLVHPMHRLQYVMPESPGEILETRAGVSRQAELTSVKAADTVNSLRSPGGIISANAGFAIQFDSVRSALYVKKLLRK